MLKKEFIIILIITGAEEENIMAEMKIAIAEDNRQALDMLGNILESDKEIQVVGKAENGTDAYNMIVKTKPDIVFLDVVMPGMDGIETTRQIRQKIGPDVSVIVLTSYDYTKIEEEAKAAGVDEFISKPLFRSRLTAALQNIIAPSRLPTDISGSS